MSVKKLNLSSESKARLRRAVLGGIGSADIKPALKAAVKPAGILTAKASPKQPSKPESAPPAVTPAAKAKPVKAKPKSRKSKSGVRPVIKSKSASIKAPLRPIIAKAPLPVSATPSPAPGPSVRPLKPAYRPFAAVKRDWENTPREESLEKLFAKTEKKKKADKKINSIFEEKPPAKKFFSHLFWKAAFLAVVIALLAVCYLIFGIYRYGFDGNFSVRLAQALRLPAGYVDNQIIGAGEYLDNFKSLAMPFAMQREGLTDYSAKSDLSDRIYFRLAANKLVAAKLADYGRAVTGQELADQVALLLEQTGSQAEADKVIQNLYGLDFDRFKSLVLLPMLQRAELQAAIVNDDSLPLTQAASARADEVLKLALTTSTDFSLLAQQYTDDEAGVNIGGDLGWVVSDQLDPAWQDLIFGAPAGTVLAEPIRTDFGFHVIKVEQKLTDSTTGVESVKLRHILVRVDVDQYIKDLLAAARVVRYIK
ncbi:MAG: peptidylprolyl isomerase [Patescibacteria group bacterium]